MLQRWCILLSGVVQGIGLRPLLHQLSAQYQLSGLVQNTAHNVTLQWQGDLTALQSALHALLATLAPFGKCDYQFETIAPIAETGFQILPSQGSGDTHTLLSPDLKTCDTCLHELFDPNNRRYQYPFITCAQCGPRYSICERLPYDRPQTSMSVFPLCPSCQKEYTNPVDRRFHAQTIACWDCGPQLSLSDHEGTLIATQINALDDTIQALHAGKIIAVKGIGGFHLMVLATHDKALSTLRMRKNRPDKPFALISKDINQVREYCEVSAIEQLWLQAAGAPITILKKKPQVPPLSQHLAPGQKYLGFMLAYTPIHHLLLRHLDVPLVATSANRKGEPLCYNNQEALESLRDIADLWLMHDRNILQPLEDSIVQVVQNQIQFIRRAKGYIPFSIPTTEISQPHLAVGGHLKNSVALYQQQQIHLSPYIGDLQSEKSIQRFSQICQRFASDKSPTVVCDRHPDSHSSQAAISIQHHQAHVFSVMAEHALKAPVLGFAWDGLGYGLDGRFWGGETFFVHDTSIEHVATLRPCTLPGGDIAIKEPRRMAASIFYEIYKKDLWQMLPNGSEYFTTYEQKILLTLFENGQNLFTTSIGRLFDAIAFLLNGMAKITFEGQAAMYVEQLAIDRSPIDTCYPVAFCTHPHIIEINWQPMIEALLADLNQFIPKEDIAHKYHQWCVAVMCNIASKFNCQHIVLSGGVFQNKLLTQLAAIALQQKGYQVYWGQEIPPNDSGLSVGQAFGVNYLCA